MSGGGGDSGGTQVTRSEPPKYVAPYAKELMTRAGKLSNQPYKGYTGNRVAPLTSQHQQAIRGITKRATQGNRATNAAENMLTQVASGKFLSPETNPYLQSNVESAQRDVRTALGGQQRGAFGNTGMDYSLGKALGDATNQVYSQNYDQERQRQMQAAVLAPQYAQQDYQDYQNLLGAGDISRQAQQENLNQRYQSWLDRRNAPYQNLDVLANAIRTTMGGGGTSTISGTPYQSNRTANMIGGGMAGYGIGQQIGQGYGGYGAAGGAILGSLL